MHVGLLTENSGDLCSILLSLSHRCMFLYHFYFPVLAIYFFVFESLEVLYISVYLSIWQTLVLVLPALNQGVLRMHTTYLIEKKNTSHFVIFRM